ncbi:protein kinase [bacterium]|nr:protein kinase [bacterium]
MADNPTQQPTPPPEPSGEDISESTRLIAQSSIVSSTEVNTASVFGGRDVQRLGHYKIVKELGRGGMGVVYKAYDEQLDRDVAIKVITPEYASLPGCVDRLRVEARAAARIVHQNIISVHAFSEDRGLHYIVMEYVEGMDLAEKLRREGPIPLAKALQYTRDAALALKYASERSVIHRDIKPSNLFVTRSAHAQATDFGLAKRLDVDSSLTVTGAIIGTPSYMAPEQGAGAEVDERSDIYSLACTLFTILAGKKPFDGRTPLEVLMQHTSMPFPIPANWKNEFGQPFIDFLLKMGAKAPEDRHQNWQEVLEHMDRLSGASSFVSPVTAPTLTMAPPPPARRSANRYTIPAIVGTLAVAMAGGAYFAFGGNSGKNPAPVATPISHSLPTPTPAPVATPLPTPLPTPTPVLIQLPDTISLPKSDGGAGDRGPIIALAMIGEAREMAREESFKEAYDKLKSIPGPPPNLVHIIGQGFENVGTGLGTANTMATFLTDRGISGKEERQKAVLDFIQNPPPDLDAKKLEESGIIYLLAVHSPLRDDAARIILQRRGSEPFSPEFVRQAYALQIFQGWVPGEPPGISPFASNTTTGNPSGGIQRPLRPRPRQPGTGAPRQ